jgi:hypothetical protein
MVASDIGDDGLLTPREFGNRTDHDEPEGMLVMPPRSDRHPDIMQPGCTTKQFQSGFISPVQRLEGMEKLHRQPRYLSGVPYLCSQVPGQALGRCDPRRLWDTHAQHFGERMMAFLHVADW